MWNLKRNDTNELTYKTGTNIDFMKELMVVGVEGEKATEKG